MAKTIHFIRAFFFILSIFFLTTYMVTGSEGYTQSNLLMGLLMGALFGALLIGFDLLFKRFNLRSFNIAILGLFFGYLMGEALSLIFSAILDISSASIHLSPQALEIFNILLFLFGIYLGTLITLRASDEIYVSIPFVRFSRQHHNKKDLLIDSSILADARIVDLANSRMLDHSLIVPRFLVKELYLQFEGSDESLKRKARKSLDTLKKLEAMQELDLRQSDTDFPDISDPMGKLTRLARLLDANILTSDLSRMQTASIEGVHIINLHTLSNALKPLMQAGEEIKIKIQRPGKEPRQGVGYLEDGTMVVVNGGGRFVGETIDARVLSVKHTSSGRMIFCNALDEEGTSTTYHGYEEDL